MDKAKKLEKDISKYTFYDFIEKIEATENEEQKKIYVNMLNTILGKEQIQVIKYNNK